MKRISLVALAASLFLSGCGTEVHVADELTTFNEAQQKGTSQLLLLNILRARDRQPLAYSHFDVLRGGISGSTSAGLSVPFGPGAAANALATGIGITPGISQDVKPQDDQDFYRGILTPLSPETWALYQDQDWNPDLLFHMFVEDIKVSREDYETVAHVTADLCREHADVSGVATSCSDLAHIKANIGQVNGCVPETFLLNGKPLLKLMNYPGDRCTQLQYDAFTLSLTILGFHIAEESTKTDIGPAMDAAPFKNTNWPFSLKGSNIEVTGNGGSYQFKTVSKDYAVALSNMPCPGAANIAVAATSEIGSQIREMNKDDKAYVAKHGLPEGCEHRVSLQIGITTRSPDGMLYYMGEVARALMPINPGEPSQTVILRGDDGRPHTLMNIVEGDIADPAVRVAYHGTTYSVPRGDSHLTMQAFELLEQVFALYNRASTAPSTTAVTVVP